MGLQEKDRNRRGHNPTWDTRPETISKATVPRDLNLAMAQGRVLICPVQKAILEGSPQGYRK